MVKITYDKTLIEKNIFSGQVRVINSDTQTEIRNVYVTWTVNNKVVGDGFKILVPNVVPINGRIIVIIKVSTRAKLSITKTITIIRKTGEF